MKPRFSSFFVFALISGILLSPTPAPAFSLFGGGEKKETLKRAEAFFEEAATAESQGRYLDQISALRSARNEYLTLQREYPNYEKALVGRQIFLTEEALRKTHQAVRDGTITIPEPEEIMRGEGNGHVSRSSEVKEKTKPDAPTFRQPPPNLIRTAATTVTGTPETAMPAESALPRKNSQQPPEPEMRAARFSGLDEALPNFRAAAVHTEPSAEIIVLPSRENAEKRGLALPREDRLRGMMVVKMLRSGQASRAISMLEDAMEREGEATSAATRILFARALLECRNYPRAQDALKQLPASLDENASVLSLRAAAAIGIGNLAEASYQLDKMIRLYPEYSDAHIDFAYLCFMLDPKNNRQQAILYYKNALTHGSRRDPRLEAELGVTIE